MAVLCVLSLRAKGTAVPDRVHFTNKRELGQESVVPPARAKNDKEKNYEKGWKWMGNKKRRDLKDTTDWHRNDRTMEMRKQKNEWCTCDTKVKNGNTRTNSLEKSYAQAALTIS